MTLSLSSQKCPLHSRLTISRNVTNPQLSRSRQPQSLVSHHTANMLPRAVLTLLLASAALGSPFPQTPAVPKPKPAGPPPAAVAPASSPTPSPSTADTIASILGLLGTMVQAKAAQPPSNKPGMFDGAAGKLLAKMLGGSPDLPALLE